MGMDWSISGVVHITAGIQRHCIVVIMMLHGTHLRRGSDVARM
jgi:hypothetical protein